MNVGWCWRALVLGTAVAVAGCYDPGFAPCTIACAPDGEACPGGMECGGDGLCVEPGGTCADTSGPVHRTIAAGAEHVCAITGNRIYCWGSNAAGQLALDGAIETADPTEIRPPTPGPGTWIDLAAGSHHTCALYDVTAAGQADEITCWGDNTSSQLGEPTADPQFFRPEAPNGASWITVGAGERHSCGIAVDAAGTGTTVYCWGANDTGQLAGTAGAQSAAPVGVPTPAVTGAWRMVDGGARHTCAVTTDAELACWGDNTAGQLSGSSSATEPRAVEPPGAYAIVAAGADHTCAITVPGTVQCWGDNTGGRLGIASAESMLDTPTEVLDAGADPRWTALDTSASVTCGIKDGATYCWGPGRPQAGLGTLGTGQATPVAAVQGLGTAVEVAASPSTSCAADGAIKCWGDSLHRELGDGTQTIAWDPATIAAPPGFTSWVSVRAGASHTCAVAAGAGSMLQTFCWGLSDAGQAGTAVPPLLDAVPAPVARDTSDTTPRTVAAGAHHTCVAYDAAPDSQVRCWGDDSLLQNPAASEGAAYTLLGSDNPEITADGAYTCVTGTITPQPRCWGTPDPIAGHASALPTTLSTNMNLRPESVTWGFESGCGLENISRAPYCFGSEHVGEIGNGSVAGDPPWPMSTPAIGVPAGIEVMARGAGQTRCAGSSAGGIYCWGDNSHGQVTPGAPGAPAEQAVQTATSGALGGQLRSIAIGASHACAIVLNGNNILCWGGFEVGQRTGLPASTALGPIQNPSPGVTTWNSVTTGPEHTCAIADGGRLLCWGRNTYGQLGTGVSARPLAAPITLP